MCAIIPENSMKKGLDKIKMAATLDQTRPDQTRIMPKFLLWLLLCRHTTGKSI
ncbi:MAG: hypothetical protein II877_00620 [Synergistaceae bacterium]|nr:hypothetical protein [Synergistaceae bacterium]